MTTPPQTPMSMTGGHSATSSISGSVLGKRDISGASESEEDKKVKKRRIAPTLVSGNDHGDVNLKEDKKAG
jgi:chromatin assembly factor 1 subunit B